MKPDAGRDAFSSSVTEISFVVACCIIIHMTLFPGSIYTPYSMCYTSFEIKFTSFNITFNFFSEFSINSTILLKNESYSDHLRQFLAHVAGNDSRWLLCYRASLHFSDTGAFHNLCDGKSNTVTIINKDEYVFGGFTDIPWGKKVVTSLFYILLVCLS